MNIKEAKQEIANTLRAYHQKDEEGNYRYPLVRQRPILLMGPPGIGKTAIMEQVAAEEQVGLVAYTITHHTRQSAIGLPRIETRSYQGQEVQVTEYTLSEIIASIYDCMERTGHQEGILFIDEINCVSETLAPTMLQFLQNKTFGSHRVPSGWMIVAAGNPPEYNKSVREFDVVTLDRVRKIDITADCSVWMDYAWDRGVHGAILSYLGIKEEHFYLVENSTEGKSFVTARGWEDLSEILKSYEELQVEIGEALITQYLQKEEIARDFHAYYQLYCKYGTDYGIHEILEGTLERTAWEEKIAMAKNASFEERFTVVNFMLAALNGQFIRYADQDEKLTALHQALKYLKSHLLERGESFQQFIQNRKNSLQVKTDAELISEKERRQESWVIKKLQEYHLHLQKDHITQAEDCFAGIKELFSQEVDARTHLVSDIQIRLERAFEFLDECFGQDQEVILFTSGLTRNTLAMDYISRHGSPAYLAHSEALLFRRQEARLQEACRELL